MIFSKRPNDPRVLMPLGMLCLALAFILPRFFHPTGNFGPDFMDGLQGGLLGMSIGLNLFSAVVAGRQRRCGQS